MNSATGTVGAAAAVQRHDIVLQCINLHHRFGAKKVLHDINLRIGRGQIVALVGPSGCGKSTLLRAIVGTHPPSEGHIAMHSGNGSGVQVVRSPGRDRGMVYQRYSLFPFLTAQQNVAFGPMLDETSIPFRTFRPFAWRQLRRRHLRAAEEMLVRVGLQDALRKYPHELSGGMCQRVAIAQAMIMRPEVMLMDEPFGALDEATREDLQRMLLSLYGENLKAKQAGEKPPYTMLLVTHELNEALYVGDRVVGLSQYWNWEDYGIRRPPGATVVYDDTAPVHGLDQVRDFERLREQRETIRRVVFDPEARTDPAEHDLFWKKVADGRAEGVLA